MEGMGWVNQRGSGGSRSSKTGKVFAFGLALVVAIGLVGCTPEPMRVSIITQSVCLGEGSDKHPFYLGYHEGAEDDFEGLSVTPDQIKDKITFYCPQGIDKYFYGSGLHVVPLNRDRKFYGWDFVNAEGHAGMVVINVDGCSPFNNVSVEKKDYEERTILLTLPGDCTLVDVLEHPDKGSP